MKVREEIASVLCSMRTFTISDVLDALNVTWDFTKSRTSWESTVRSYIRILERRGYVRKIDKVKRNGRFVTLYQSLVMYAPPKELKW